MDVEWAKLLGENVAEKVKTIGQIWAAMGIEGTRLQARKETLSTHLYSMLDAMFDEEIVAQQTIVNSIKELKVKISELESELGFSHSTLVEPLNLIQTEKALFDRFKLLEEKASSITETFNSLRNEEEALAARLDEPTAVILFRHVPNQGQLRTLKDNLDFLTQEKRSRLLRLSELRQEILNIHEAVDIGDLATRSLFTRLKSEDALETLPLSKAFLSEVETFQCACEQLLSAVRSECDQLCVEIEKLALRLNLDHADFLDLDQPTSSSFLTQLREERDRLTELRRKNLSVFIHNCQTELQELWDACRLSEHDRVAAMSWDSEDCSESVLERLEAEIVYWKNFHADHKDVFESLDAWQTSFSQFRDTELKKKDPVILKNRGGILLQVEKQYKQLQREVKRLETLLQKLAADPLHSNLMIHGMKILEFMEASRRQQLEDKENDVNQRRPAQLKPIEFFTFYPRRKGDGSPAISSTNRSVRGRYPGNKAACNETPISSRVKKPRLDSSRTLVTRTPLRQFGLPQGEPLRSAQVIRMSVFTAGQDTLMMRFRAIEKLLADDVLIETKRDILMKRPSSACLWTHTPIEHASDCVADEDMGRADAVYSLLTVGGDLEIIKESFILRENSDASNVRWWSSGNTLSSLRMSDVRGSNPGTATGYALLMSSNKSETRVQCFPLVWTHRNNYARTGGGPFKRECITNGRFSWVPASSENPHITAYVRAHGEVNTDAFECKRTQTRLFDSRSIES
ncbi:protein regulator of cytokinesis 1 [Clonorchis sinensis]|uniref:Protein regulator of cytokinesis 1 n=1 Tax=Clonorchis sinensis TaxID=79923 RepID=G7YFQ3_CLOSI|nr:protein regulator of cytokinesis 1 [Clonorchis sinensis]